MKALRPTSPKITFIRVKDNQEKCACILQRAQAVFFEEKRLLIAVPNMEAAQYVDTLIWHTPEDSFIPHTIAQGPCQDWIAITTLSQNVNQAQILLNLSPQACSFYLAFEQVYELYDASHPQKEALAKQKLVDYQAKGILVSFEKD